MIVPTDKPRWYDLRWRLSILFVRVAYKIYPKNPEVTAFWMDLVMDHMITGKSIVRINPIDKERTENAK